jgi:hypothetical protein
VWAQDKKDTLKPQAPQSVRIFTNLYLPAQRFFSDKLLAFEASAEWWQKNGYAWVGEAGYSSRIRHNGAYEVNGTYLRLGIEKGFWELQPQRRAIGAWQSGLRLAIASFNYRNETAIGSGYWGSALLKDNSKGMFAFWAEWHTSLRAKIGKYFVMGPMLRVKTLLYSSATQLTKNPPEIAGYGIWRGMQAEAGYWIGIWLGK